MNLKDIYFFQDVSQIEDSAVLKNENKGDLLAIQIVCDGSFNLHAEGCVDVSLDVYQEVAAINMDTLDADVPITSPGLYHLDVGGYRKIRLVLDNIGSSPLTAYGLLKDRREPGDGGGDLTNYYTKRQTNALVETKAVLKYSTMPTANIDTMGKIVQYIGDTDATYTNGYFYKGISDGAAEPTYSWDNINVQDGATYTAGTNIEITNEGVINNKIPFADINGNMFIGKAYNEWMTGQRSINIGFETQPTYSGYDNVLIGYGAKGIFSEGYTAGNSVIIGSQANSQYKQTIAIGNKAKTTKVNQAMFGGESAPINEMVIYTSNGAKEIATEDYVDAAIENLDITNRKIVQELPTEDISTKTIYMVPKETAGSQNVYTEYMYINNAWEKIGDTEIDLSTKQDIMQFSTMPTASADNLGKIYQYVGLTGDYIQGYFYKCVSDGESTPTYSWEQVDVQDGASYTAGTNISIDNNNAINCAIPYTESGNDSLTLGINRSFVSSYSQNVVIGRNTSPSAYCKRNVIIGYGASANGIIDTTDSVAIGSQSRADKHKSIQIGVSAMATKENQVMFGSSSIPMNEMAMTTSNGVKVMATEEYVIQKAYELAGLSAYDSTTTYAVDDYVYYNLLIYKCNTAVSVAEDFDSTKWTQKTYVEYLIDTLNIPSTGVQSSSNSDIDNLFGGGE